MGMYTELHFNSRLKRDAPKNVIGILKYMLDKRESLPALPEHPLFKTDEWRFMLKVGSYYFDADTHSTLRFDENIGSYYLCVRGNLKNYDHEIQHFISWITPYLDKYEGEFLGFYRYEEDEEPTLIYMNAKIDKEN